MDRSDSQPPPEPPRLPRGLAPRRGRLTIVEPGGPLWLWTAGGWRPVEPGEDAPPAEPS